MSRVTNLIVSFSVVEEDEEIGKFFDHVKDAMNEVFVNIDDAKLPRGWYGGTKMMEANLWLGAFNYFNLESFKELLRKWKWERLEEIQLIVMGQDDDIFRIETLDQGRPKERYIVSVPLIFGGEFRRLEFEMICSDRPSLARIKEGFGQLKLPPLELTFLGRAIDTARAVKEYPVIGEIKLGETYHDIYCYQPASMTIN